MDYDRVANIMPNWAYWGGGVILVSKKEWQSSETKIAAILNQLSKTKKQYNNLRDENARLRKCTR